MLTAGVRHGAHTVMGADIARVDADFIHPLLHAAQRQLIVEMDVCHQRDVDGPADSADGIGGRHIGHGHADDLAAGRLQRANLGHGGRRIGRFRVAHGLYRNRGAAAHRHGAHLDLLAHGFTFM